jgi:hypothetical protein
MYSAATEEGHSGGMEGGGSILDQECSFDWEMTDVSGLGIRLDEEEGEVEQGCSCDMDRSILDIAERRVPAANSPAGAVAD